MSERITVTRRQRQVLRKIADGHVLMAEANGESWLFRFDPDGEPFTSRYQPVERISDILAERLVLRGLVRGVGTLTDAGRAALGDGGGAGGA